MHDARAIANFFIDQAAASSQPLTIMTLLKVMYFSHAWYLVKHDKPLIGQPFEAWKYGPVIRVIYDQHKVSDDSVIKCKFKSFDINSTTYQETKYILTVEEKKFLTEMFEYYSKFHAFRLSDLTHEEGSPWDTIWKQASQHAVPGMVIPNESIRSWFSEQGSLYWTNRKREHLS